MSMTTASAMVIFFRSDRGVRQAIADLTGVPGIDGMYAYKADIHDYFNSVEVSGLLPLLWQVMGETEPDLFEFLRKLLENEWVLWEGKEVRAKKGIMAGVPVSSFLANLYLREMDAFFAQRACPMRVIPMISCFLRRRESSWSSASGSCMDIWMPMACSSIRKRKHMPNRESPGNISVFPIAEV